MKETMIAMLLAGGKGTRLESLTKRMAKPAVYFGGRYRIIDFPLSNCANSGIDIVGVLLIASLMIIPVASAILIGDSFFNTVVSAIVFSEVSLVTGFVISYHTNVTTGPVIIIINILILIAIMVFKKIRLSIKGK